MKSKFWHLSILVLLLASLLLSACGSQPTPVTTAPPAATEAAATETVAPTTPAPATGDEYEMLVLAGTFEAQLGCSGDWMPDCAQAALTRDASSGLWTATFDLTAGAYEYKVTANGGWDINFGKDGAPGGDNLTFTLAQDAPVTFTFDPATKLVTLASEGLNDTPPAASAAGSLVIWADKTRVPALKALAASFKTEYSIDITVEELAFGDVRDVFLVAGPAGQGPDIIVGPHDWLGELVASGLIAPLELGDKMADFTPAALEAFTYQGELYGMPNAIENLAFFRNVDLAPEAPQTWDEVVAISRELTANNGADQDKNRYGFIREEGNPYYFFPIQTAFGGYVFGHNTDGTWNPQDVGMDNAGSLAAAQWYADLFTAGIQPKAMTGETAVSWFEQGKAAMIIEGPWNLPRIKKSGVRYAISNIPSGAQAGQPFLGAQGFMVSAFSKEPLLAQVFLAEFVATTETMQRFYDADPRPPAYLPLLETLEDPDIVAFSQAGANAVPMPAIPEMGAVWEAWNNALTLIAQGSDTPDSAFRNAAQQIRDAINKSQ